MSADVRDDAARDARRRWLAESLDGVCSWPSAQELVADEWHFSPNEAEFVNLCTPREIHALLARLEAAAARNETLVEFVHEAIWEFFPNDIRAEEFTTAFDAALAGGDAETPR